MSDTTSVLTIDDVAEAMDAAGLKYRKIRDHAISLGFGGFERYTNRSGEKSVDVVIDLSSRRMSVVVPNAWLAPDDDHRAAVLETCLRLQWRYFGIRFEFDHHDGELRASFDFHPSSLPQASRVPDLVRAMCLMLDTVHPPIESAIRDGVVWVEDSTEVVELAEELSALTPEQIRLLLAAVREEVPA